MDRWAGADRDFDRWGGPDRNDDHWAGADREYDRWAEAEPEYDRRDRLTGRARSPRVKWVGLLIAWVIITGILLAVHLTILIWVIMVGLIGYVIYGIVQDTPRAERPRRPQRQAAPKVPHMAVDGRERFNAPPGWPEPPPGWTPPPGWQPNPSWPPAPPGWQFWLRPVHRSAAEPTRRHRRDDRDGAADNFWSTDF